MSKMQNLEHVQKLQAWILLRARKHIWLGIGNYLKGLQFLELLANMFITLDL